MKADGAITALNFNAMGMLIHRTFGRWGSDYGGPLFRPGSLTNSVTEGESATGGLNANGVRARERPGCSEMLRGIYEVNLYPRKSRGAR